jgi:hypothetical protein
MKKVIKLITFGRPPRYYEIVEKLEDEKIEPQARMEITIQYLGSSGIEDPLNFLTVIFVETGK